MRKAIPFRVCYVCKERKYFPRDQRTCNDHLPVINPIGMVLQRHGIGKNSMKGKKPPSQVPKGYKSPKLGRIIHPKKRRANPNDRYNFYNPRYEPAKRFPSS